MEHVVELMFKNMSYTKPKITKILCDEDSIEDIMAWYNAYHFEDLYTAYVNGKHVATSVNGEPV